MDTTKLDAAVARMDALMFSVNSKTKKQRTVDSKSYTTLEQAQQRARELRDRGFIVTISSGDKEYAVDSPY
jgi:hypothetical protein